MVRFTFSKLWVKITKKSADSLVLNPNFQEVMNLKISTIALCLLFLLLCSSCSDKKSQRIKVIFDTDTNNELDDQHALAYLLMNEDIFKVEAITVNATSKGGGVDEQYTEAKRIMRLVGKLGTSPLLKGADRSFNEIYEYLDEEYYDGFDAVEYIINRAKAAKKERVVIIAVGKLTNIALALDKAPEISQHIRLVWLGSNYPDPGEYNLENDIEALNFVLSTDVPFEMVLVRYGQGNGTDAVRVSQAEIRQKMSQTGHQLKTSIIGRDGREYYSFGDYSISLFEQSKFHGSDQKRALFDMAAVAIIKNPGWAEKKEIPAPQYENGTWTIYPDNSRTITIWDNFNRDAIMEDFFKTVSEK